jgi:DNA repair exonuclease SbcCD nuclease subunit
MKFLILGDLHITNKNPDNRLDAFPLTQRHKIDNIFDVAQEEGVKAILQPGDLFDHYHMPDIVKREWILYFREKGIPVLTIPGQHDMRYHSSNIENTPMGVLDASEAVRILSNTFPYVFIEKDYTVQIYGAGWNAEIPEIVDTSAINILLIHKLIVQEKIWEGQKDPVKSKSFLFKNKFDLIVSGDNHQSFIETRQDRFLINCGSLMRSRIDQTTHRPCFYIYDAEKKEVKKHLILIEPFAKVLNVAVATKEKEDNKQLEAFVKGLSKEESIEGLDFTKNAEGYVKENKDKLRPGAIIMFEKEVMA